MQLVLATSNKGKVREIQEIWSAYNVYPYSAFIEPFEIIEDGMTFKENALIKARAVYEALKKSDKFQKDMIVVADDSGISVDILDGAPGIYSARYAGKNADDKQNLNKLIESIKETGAQESLAHYTAAIALVGDGIEKSVHGWMYGTAITQARGEGGFGYDPMFIPLGFDQTLGELDNSVKQKLSHRYKALELAKKLLERL